MTPSHLDADTLAALAIDALDAQACTAAQAHLASCEPCRREFASLRRVTAGLALAIEPETPPASLRARTIAAATAPAVTPFAAPAPSTAPNRPAPGTRRAWPGLATAAALVLAIGAGLYAISLRAQIADLSRTVTTLMGWTESLRGQLDDARRESARLTTTMHVLRAPDTVRVDLRGVAPATAASSGRAYVSAARGLVVDVLGMPALPAGRVYQLWVLRGGAVASAGVFTVASDGAASLTSPLPGNTLPDAVAITIEDGPNGTGQPTMNPIVIGTR